jgi:serpin B
VSDQTEDRINNLLPEGSITPLTRLVLTNAIYFKANWLSPFEEENTYDENFYPADGNTVTIPMMHQTQTTRYYEVSGEYQAVKLNYMGTRSNSMIIILPAEGRLSSFESGFTNTIFNTIKQEMSTYRVVLTFPKFSYRWGESIAPFLKSLGMEVSFSGNADFTRITNEERLYIEDVIHKAFIAVDEIGTEAAAATAVIVPGGVGPGPTPEPPPLVTMTINRPFLFLICNDNTGTILFIGRVVTPE